MKGETSLLRHFPLRRGQTLLPSGASKAMGGAEPLEMPALPEPAFDCELRFHIGAVKV